VLYVVIVFAVLAKLTAVQLSLYPSDASLGGGDLVRSGLVREQSKCFSVEFDSPV